MAEKKRDVYIVTLDGTKCRSLTLRGVKYTPTRPVWVSEDKLEPFQVTAVFNIQKVGTTLPVDPTPVARRKTGTGIAETNPADKGDAVQSERSNEKPSGVITTNDTTK
jgi:hypothetical protein